MANDTGFEELALPLSAFGLNPGDPLHLEIWMTQDGTSKPPLDAVFSDGVQASTPAGTTFDVTTPVEMTGFLQFDIINAVDEDPPFVSQVAHRVDSQIQVTFNEPVDPVTAQDPGNYTVSGGLTAVTVTGATVDAQVPSIVHLDLSQDIVATSGAYQVTVTGVTDLADNPILEDGVHNVGCFALKYVVFEGKFGPYLDANGTGDDGFTVEGSKFPLTFDLCDGADMAQVDPVEEIWRFSTDFSFPVNCSTGSGSLTVAWKFVHNCATYESISDRTFTLELSSPESQVLSHWWNDLDPTSFTDKDIDVVFTVDMFRQDPVLGVDEVALGGSALPLGFEAPFTPLVDDGTGQDAVAGDQIYTTTVTFPAGTLKNVGYKFLLNGSFECPETGNRGLFLDDTLYDTIGGTNGPLVLDLAYFNRCYVIGRDVEAWFRVDISKSDVWLNGLPAEVVLTGSVAPLAWDPLSSVVMHDDGVEPDETAADGVFSVSVVFPDSSSSFLEFKYAVNGVYEGQNQPNRFVGLDDGFDAVGSPQVLPIHDLHLIAVTGAPDLGRAQAAKIRGAMPNPFNPRTTIVYETARAGRVLLEIYDARGRRVATLVDGEKGPGEHRVVWDGRDAASGVYHARLVVPGAADGAKLVLLK
jgi:hypothetical protein